MTAAVKAAARIFVVVPPPQPSRSKTVAVARVAMMARKVSQPIETSQETYPGTRWPVTPNAARESTIVGAEPRLPAIAMMPTSAKEIVMPIAATSTAWPKETPKP